MNASICASASASVPIALFVPLAMSTTARLFAMVYSIHTTSHPQYRFTRLMFRSTNA